MYTNSWRHHYLPVFYLKGFVKESNHLKLYDVINRRFVKNGKNFSLKAIFFEQKGNTITNSQGNEDDLVERHYSEFENKIAPILLRINSSHSENRYGVTESDMPLLNNFVSLMYWRLPHHQKELQKFIKEADFKHLGIECKNEDGTTNLEMQDKLRQDKNFYTIYKLYNSFADSARGIHCRTPYSILEKNSELPYMCSDNPIIFESLHPAVYKDNYIFSLTGSKYFLRTSRQTKFDSVLWYLIDLLCFMQAQKFVACTDVKYIEMLISMIEKNKYTIEEVRYEIFKKIKI